MTLRFFSFSPELGFDTHHTAEEAQKEAESALDEYRENAADEGWDEDAERICWGEIRQTVVERKVPAEEGATFEGEPITEYVAYDLTDTQAE